MLDRYGSKANRIRTLPGRSSFRLAIDQYYEFAAVDRPQRTDGAGGELQGHRQRRVARLVASIICAITDTISRR
jgi:hypothetical protein